MPEATSPPTTNNVSPMKTKNKVASRFVILLTVLCTAFLAYNIAAIPIYKDHVFLERGSINTFWEMLILIGFIFVFLFNIVAILWLSLRLRHAATRRGDIGTLALGVLCLVLLLGVKVMVDEISHEYSLGREVAGEWIILYVFLAIQLVYNIKVLRKACQRQVA